MSGARSYLSSDAIRDGGMPIAGTVPWEPDVVFGTEERPVVRCAPWLRRLMLEVLRDGVALSVRRASESTSQQKLQREAWAWVQSGDTRWPFSFVNVCFVLGFDPEYIRRGVAAQRAAIDCAGGGTEVFRPVVVAWQRRSYVARHSATAKIAVHAGRR